MKITPQRLGDVLLIEPAVYADPRGYFLESYQEARYREAGLPAFVQDNLSSSRRAVLRGLHFQHPNGQGKLVMALEGEIFDVAVDIRDGSPTFGAWTSARLSAQNHHQLYLPPGFAHGFCVVSESALVAYKCTTFYHPPSEVTVLFSDPALAIDWPIDEPIVSDKDRAGVILSALPAERLPPMPR
jgi:dTDP-4-dehydrorhamnose 3,5-epimerase